MYCPKCGTQNENGAKFCASCGLDLSGESTVSVASPAPQPQAPQPQAPQPQAPQPQAPQYQAPQPQAPHYQAPQYQAPQNANFQPAENNTAKKFNLEMLKKNKKTLLCVGAAIVALILLIVIISAIFSGSKYESVEYNFYSTSEDGDKIVVYYDGKEIGSYEVDDEYSANLEAISENLDVFVVDAGESLVYITTKKVEVLDIDADSVWLSDDGKTIVYTYSDPDSEKRTTTLNTYDVKSKKSTEIAEDAKNINVSPDGKTVLYNIYDESDGETKVELWLYKKGEANKIGKKLYAYEIDNKAKYIYVTDDEGKFYIYDSKEESKEKIKDSVSDAIFNDDKSQVMFVHEGKAYISIKGKEAESVFKATDLSLLSPNYCSADTADLGGHVFYNGDSVWYLDSSKKEAVKLVGDVRSAYLTEDGDRVYYSKYDDDELSIGYVDVSKKPEQVEIVEEDVRTFDITSDGLVYFINDDDELMYYTKKKPVKVADDVDSLEISYGDVVLFEQDETLFYVKGKSDKVKISDDVTRYGSSAGYTFYLTEYSDEKGTADVYIGGKGNKFKNLAKEVQFSTTVVVY